MSRRFIGAALLLAVFLSLPALTSPQALAQKKKANDPAKVDTIDSGKFVACQLDGILKTTPGSDRLFNVECAQDRLVPTGKGNGNINPTNNPKPAKAPNMSKVNQAQQKIQQAMQHGQQAQAKLASAKNAQDQKKAQGDLTKAQGELNKAQGEYQTAVLQVIVQSNAQQNTTMLAAIRKYGVSVPAGYKVDKVKALVEFQSSETIKVRTLVLPEEFDEKGKPKKYTKEELAELKGKDKNLPGYESSLDKLETGQRLRVVLAAVKKPVAKAKDADKDDEKDVPEEKDKADKKMQVKLIVILEESTGTGDSAKGKEKKK